jgi:DMSO/TMAO reductase YedYZ molybdopterin-dependent catalytic subunit
VAAASGVLTFVTVGQTWPLLRRFAVLAPRKPADDPVNESALAAGVVPAITSADYRLTVEGRNTRTLVLTHDELRAMPQHSPELPIVCVEGWSYSARWTGPRLKDLLAMVGAPSDAAAYVYSMQEHSLYRIGFVNHFQAHDPDTNLALQLEGEDLSPDHGYPVRLIGPDRAGVTQTKWVNRIEVV